MTEASGTDVQIFSLQCQGGLTTLDVSFGSSSLPIVIARGKVLVLAVFLVYIIFKLKRDFNVCLASQIGFYPGSCALEAELKPEKQLFLFLNPFPWPTLGLCMAAIIILWNWDTAQGPGE